LTEAPRPKSKLTAVDLDHQSVLEGDEVDDVGADGSLFGSAELAGTELLPEALLGLGERTLNLPSPQPSPIAGKGSRVVEDVLAKSSRTTERELKMNRT